MAPNYMGHQVYHVLTIAEEPVDLLRGGEVPAIALAFASNQGSS